MTHPSTTIDVSEPFVSAAAETIASARDRTAFTEHHPQQSDLPDGKQSTDLTFGDLDDRSNRIARQLRADGVEPGDTVAMQLPNWVEFPLAYLATLKAGATAVPILPEHRASEVGFILDLAECDVFLVPSTFRGFDHVDMVESLVADGTVDPSVVYVVGSFESEDSRFQPWSTLESPRPDPLEAEIETAMDDVEQVMFTSGTTGEPKGVRQSAETGMHQTAQPIDVLGLDETDVIFGASPLAHNTGIHYYVRLGLLLGARVVLVDRWDPDAALEILDEEDCTFSIGATTFLKDLLDQSDVSAYSLPELELFALAGSAIPAPVVEEAYRRFENLTVMAIWGQTENGIVTATRLDDDVKTVSQTDGAPIPGREVTVRREYDGEEITNEPGKLLMRGNGLMDGYLKRPEITSDSFTENGWFKTGDVAVLQEDGYISIRGREKDLIIRGGQNISAAEVEEALIDHPAIREVALVPMPDDRLQERPCAYVRPVPGEPAVGVDTLSEFLDEYGLQRHKHPERVEVVTEFPRTSTGKVQKYKLREDVAAKLGKDPV